MAFDDLHLRARNLILELLEAHGSGEYAPEFYVNSTRQGWVIQLKAVNAVADKELRDFTEGDLIQLEVNNYLTHDPTRPDEASSLSQKAFEQFHLNQAASRLRSRQPSTAHSQYMDDSINTTMANTTRREQVFFSYSHKDKKWLELFQAALKPIIRSNQFSVWDDTRIKAGDIWRDEIKQGLASAKVAVLLVSMNFYQSDFIAENELPPLLDAAQDEGLKILLVIVGHSLFDKTELGRYQAVNDPSKPLATMTAAGRDKEIIRICKEIIAAVTSTEGVQSIAPTASGKSTFMSPAAHIEELVGRVKELERENAALEKARENASNLYEEASKKIERLQNDVDILQSSNASRISELEQLSWLRGLAQNERANFNGYVYIIFSKVKYEGLDKIEPYIEIFFDIINASVYPIIIDKNIEDGAVYFNDIRLKPKLAELDGSLHIISRDDRKQRFLVIRQGVFPELAKRIKERLPDDKLFFNRLHLQVRAKVDGTETSPQRLSLPESVSIGIPTPREQALAGTTIQAMSVSQGVAPAEQMAVEQTGAATIQNEPARYEPHEAKEASVHSQTSSPAAKHTPELVRWLFNNYLNGIINLLDEIRTRFSTKNFPLLASEPHQRSGVRTFRIDFFSSARWKEFVESDAGEQVHYRFPTISKKILAFGTKMDDFDLPLHALEKTIEASQELLKYLIPLYMRKVNMSTIPAHWFDGSALPEISALWLGELRLRLSDYQAESRDFLVRFTAYKLLGLEPQFPDDAKGPDREEIILNFCADVTKAVRSDMSIAKAAEEAESRFETIKQESATLWKELKAERLDLSLRYGVPF